MFRKLISTHTAIVLSLSIFLGILLPTNSYAATLSGSSGFGISGTITSPPPTSAATIASPSNGQTFTNLPITVSGVCVSGLLIKVFINGIFSGSADCTNNSYSIQTDLFLGTDNIIAEDFDSLNQAGPNSNTVTVSYVNNAQSAQSAVTLTTNYAKLGANPGSELSWPISITGGTAPYALSVNWGDSKQPSLISQSNAGNLTLTHTYSIAGVYNVTIDATDKNGNVAFLQVVGVGDGPASQSSGSSNSKTATVKTVGLDSSILALIIALLIIIPIVTFWLGDMHQKKVIQSRFQNNKRPF